jgi:hypothetical protein
MKSFLSVFLLFFIAGNIYCDAQGNTPPKAVAPKVQVYYFHFTHRCSTCLSVEATAKKAVEALYAAQVKNGYYTFSAINLDDESSKPLADKLSIGGQTLIIVSGNNKVDITDQGFLHSRDLEKMKVEISKAVDKVLKG